MWSYAKFLTFVFRMWSNYCWSSQRSKNDEIICRQCSPGEAKRTVYNFCSLSQWCCNNYWKCSWSMFPFFPNIQCNHCKCCTLDPPNLLILQQSLNPLTNVFFIQNSMQRASFIAFSLDWHSFSGSLFRDRATFNSEVSLCRKLSFISLTLCKL